MKKGLWQKRIPTVAAILLLFGSIWVTTLLIQKQILFIGRATPDKTPQNIVISNISIFPLFPITPYNLATITYILAAFLLFLIKPKKLIRKTNNE